MFAPKKIAYKHAGENTQDNEIAGSVLLALDMKDRNGVEYHDGDILKTFYNIDGIAYPMLGFIRYFGGRFEIVCTWKAIYPGKGEGFERFILGLNPTHEIIGNMMDPADGEDHAGIGLIAQSQTLFKKEGGISA